jgi:hypothetical protein
LLAFWIGFAFFLAMATPFIRCGNQEPKS